MTDSAPRTILFANNFPGPTLGGGEVHLMYLVRAALAEGWRVCVAAAKGSALAGDARAAGAEVFELEYSRARMPSKPGRLRDIAAAYDADVIVGTGFLTNMLVRRAAVGLEGTKVVNIVHTEPDASRHEGSGPLRQGIKFGTDGWRAVIAPGDDFTYERCGVSRMPPAASSPRTTPAGVLVGYDTRFEAGRSPPRRPRSSPRTAWRSSSPTATCPRRRSAGRSRATRRVGGVMLTASHNPAATSASRSAWPTAAPRR
jgi:hypothetical protein